MAVYIPTLDRLPILERTVPEWIKTGMPVYLVVDPMELKRHIVFRNDHVWHGQVGIVPVPRNGKGIGFKRRFIVQHADQMGYPSFVMADDDHKPREPGMAEELLLEAARDDVLGIGATVQIYARFTAGAINRLRGPILWPGGAGFSVYGLNVRNALAVGNFDSALYAFGEDAELRRLGITHGFPWRVHADVRVDAVNQRNSPGGFMAKFNGSMADRTSAELACRAIIYERWPQYVSPPDKPPRMAWQRMLTDYIPDWRAHSALHRM